MLFVSVMMNDVEHLLTRSLAVGIPSLEKRLSKLVVRFKTRWAFSLLSFRCSLYILDINLLADL